MQQTLKKVSVVKVSVNAMVRFVVPYMLYQMSEALALTCS